MKTYLNTILLMLCMIMFFHCSGPPPLELDITCEDCQELSSAEGAFKVHVHAPHSEYWDFETEGSWIKVQKFATDSLLVSYLSNSSIEERIAYLRVSASRGRGTSLAGTAFTQEGAVPLKLSSTNVQIKSLANDTMLLVTSYGGVWQAAETPAIEWLKLRKVGADRLVLIYEENTTDSPRLATIRVYIPPANPNREDIAEKTILLTQAVKSATP